MNRIAPVFYVKIFPAKVDGGGEIVVSERVQSLTYEDDEAKADKCVLQVDNFDLSNQDAPIWKQGAKIEVSWGYIGNMSQPRLCTIQKVTGSTTLNVEALDPSVLMNKTQKVRTFEYMKRSDVAATIAEEHGYGADFRFIDDTEEIMFQVTQARMTDGQLLRDMAKREGYEFYVDFDGFHFHKRKLGQKPLRVFTYYLDGSGDCSKFNIENDLYTRKTGGVTVKARDPLTKKDISAEGNNATSGKQTAVAPVKTLYTGISQKDGAVTGDFTQESGSSSTVRSTEATAAAVKRQAAALYGKAQMNAAEITFDGPGDPQMIAKVIITMRNIGKTTSGNYYVTKVTHKLGQGYTMAVKAKRDGRSAINNSAAYGQAAGMGGGSGAPVKPKGPVNDAPSPTPASAYADMPGYDATKDPSSIFYRDPLPQVTNPDGTVNWRYAGGRTYQEAPYDATKDPSNYFYNPNGTVTGTSADAPAPDVDASTDLSDGYDATTDPTRIFFAGSS